MNSPPPSAVLYIPVQRTWRAIGEGKKDGGALFPNCAADNEQHKTQSRQVVVCLRSSRIVYVCNVGIHLVEKTSFWLIPIATVFQPWSQPVPSLRYVYVRLCIECTQLDSPEREAMTTSLLFGYAFRPPVCHSNVQKHGVQECLDFSLTFKTFSVQTREREHTLQSQT